MMTLGTRTFLVLGLAAAACFVPWRTAAAGGGGVAAPEGAGSSKGSASHRLIRLALANGLGDGNALTLCLGCLGGRVRNVWLTGGADQTYRGYGLPANPTRGEIVRALPIRFRPPFFVDVSNLKIGDGAISGQFGLDSAPLVIPGDEAKRGRRGGDEGYCFDVQVAVSGKTAKGTYKVVHGKAVGRSPAGGPRWDPAKADRSGEVTGTLLTWQDVHALHGIPAGKDWPAFGGPTGGGAAIAADRELVSDFRDARLLWKSEEFICDGWSGHGRAWLRYNLSGGYAAPIVYDGNVYVSHYHPSGEVDGVSMARSEQPRNAFEEKWLMSADDILLCIDGATGMTIWRQVKRDKGINCNLSCSGPWACPCAADGRVFFLGSGGMVYALDARTGETRWEYETDLVAATRRAKAAWARDKAPRGSNPIGVSTSLATAGGILAVPKNGLAGLDVADGREVWRVKAWQPNRTAPIRWVHKGQEYFIAGGGQCIRPQDGAVLWALPFRAGSTQVIAVNEDYAVGQSKRRPATYTGCRISPDGMTKLWEREVHSGEGNLSTPVLANGCAYIIVWAHRQISRLDLKTGEILEVMGGHRLEYYFAFSNDRIVSGTGFAYVDATPGKMKVLNALQYNEPVHWAPSVADCIPPIIADGRLIYRGGNAIYCYDLREPVAAGALGRQKR